MASKKAPAAPTPAKPFTTADAHRFILRDYDNKRNAALARARREVQRHIEQLQRVASMLDANQLPYQSDRYVDDSNMQAALTEAATADEMFRVARSWLDAVDA